MTPAISLSVLYVAVNWQRYTIMFDQKYWLEREVENQKVIVIIRFGNERLLAL